MVSRGFAHCVFQWSNGYKLHVVGTHLKSKRFHPLGQTDMRRYEARQLRYLFDKIIKEDPDANVLIAGDFNDAPNSSPISTVCGRRYKFTRQLYDLRPFDKYGMSWTYLWDEGETYSRIDYAFASYALLPEIEFEQTCVPFVGEWYVASDHRPLVVTLHPSDREAAPGILSQFEKNRRKAPVPMSSFHEGRVVGTRKVRREQ